MPLSLMSGTIEVKSRRLCGVDKQLKMAADLGKMDESVKQYLLYRGLNATAKALENELKTERDRIFRADKIMDQIHSYINSHDITSLRDYWSFLEQHLFSYLDAPYPVVIHRLVTNLFRIYLVNALQSGRNEKVTEFFEKMTPHLSSFPEWKDWYVLPFTKNPEEQQPFMMYFSKQWQDTVFLCLHNFLSSILVNMPKPVLLNYEGDSKLIIRLEKENQELRKQVSHWQLQASSQTRTKSNSAADDCLPINEGCSSIPPLSPSDANDLTDSVDPYSMPTSVELLDDFYSISQSTPEAEKPTPRTEQFKSFIRNIGLPSSPVLSKKSSTATLSSQTSLVVATAAITATATTVSVAPSGDRQVKPATGHAAQLPRPLSSKALAVTASPITANVNAISDTSDSSLSANAKPQISEISTTVESPYLLLSQDEYKEHSACIAQCRFSFSGDAVATLDVDGVLKTWTIQPSPITVASTMSKSVLTSVEWINDRTLLLGSKVGTIRLFDIKEKKISKEVTTDNTYPRIVGFATHPLSSTFVTSAVGRLRGNNPCDHHAPRVGRLSVWDMKTMTLERHLLLAPGPIAINCLSYNRNGNLLLTGGADGVIRLYDLKSENAVEQWLGHTGEVHTALFDADETSCYSIGSDGKLVQWSINKAGHKMADLAIHSGATGPFMTAGVGSQKNDIMQSPRGKLFALDTDGTHLLTCSSKGGIIYKLDKERGLERVLNLEGHKSPVICVDWSTSVHYKLCLTASVDGRVRLSTLLTK